MKILYIHNNYAHNNSGEEHAAESIVGLLRQNGHEVEWYRRRSDEVNTVQKKTMAFFTGIWNPLAVKEVIRKLEAFKPDIVQIQNLYPLISPAVVKAIKSRNIPVVMRCPNYRLFCPSGLHLNPRGEVCEKCLTGGKEIHCILNNCERNIVKSSGYALRNFTARTLWDIYKQVDVFLVQSSFQKNKFIKNGIPASKITVVPGLTPELSTMPDENSGEWVSFVGRASREKGILEFVQAARSLPHINFAVAGSIHPDLLYLEKESTENMKWTGFLSGQALDQLYKESKIIVVPGKWYEGFPNVITRAMKHGKPVITSNLGAMASIIDHEKNGLLVNPGDAEMLAQSIRILYDDPHTCRMYGQNGKKKAEQEFSAKKIYSLLIDVYNSL